MTSESPKLGEYTREEIVADFHSWDPIKKLGALVDANKSLSDSDMKKLASELEDQVSED